MRRKYSAFTLVEMLIVMGIIVILMAIGISVGRYAILRANRIEHQSAADELFRTLMSFKNQEGYYPSIGSCGTCIEEQFFAEALGYKGEKHMLIEYLDENVFSGGSDATYYYYVDPADSQLALVCVSLGGIDDQNRLGYYCTGDGIGYIPYGNPLTSKVVGSELEDPYNVNVIRGLDASDWHTNEGFASID